MFKGVSYSEQYDALYTAGPLNTKQVSQHGNQGTPASALISLLLAACHYTCCIKQGMWVDCHVPRA